MTKEIYFCVYLLNRRYSCRYTEDTIEDTCVDTPPRYARRYSRFCTYGRTEEFADDDFFTYGRTEEFADDDSFTYGRTEEFAVHVLYSTLRRWSWKTSGWR